MKPLIVIALIAAITFMAMNIIRSMIRSGIDSDNLRIHDEEKRILDSIEQNYEE